MAQLGWILFVITALAVAWIAYTADLVEELRDFVEEVRVLKAKRQHDERLRLLQQHLEQIDARARRQLQRARRRR